jgi:hypothetical protein
MACNGNTPWNHLSADEQKRHGLDDWNEKQHYTRLIYMHKFQSAAAERKLQMISNPSLQMSFSPEYSFELVEFDPKNSDQKRQFSLLWNRFIKEQSKQ